MIYLHALLPADPQVSSSQETGHGVPSQMVNPALLPQLSHDGVNPREAGPTLRPLGQCLWVAVPRDLDTDGVVLHLVKAGVVGGSCVEELTPQQLTIERQRRGAVLLHLAEKCWEIPLPSGGKKTGASVFQITPEQLFLLPSCRGQ